MSELLAPAGSPDAGYAALAYGADALYLGLDRFSARAEADNFTPGQLAEIAAYAHSLTPRRNVYLALNTLVKQGELAEAARTLFAAAEAGIDAVIVQDLGVARLAKGLFPALRLHASTQMAVHSLEGVKAAADLGFDRVVLARELTLAEIERVAAGAEIEIEAFIHGTLCYSYSGLCLFSSMAAGRSGNRGRCVYSCREAARTPDGRGHLFSLKDMALGGRVADLVRAGVAGLKIEGRKKSPLYVAATVDHYRRLLDGAMRPGEAEASEARLKTIFARPWTRFFLDGTRNPDAADPEVVGHRGSPFGVVEHIAPTPVGPGIVFTPSLPLERHDGIQIDVPGQDRPYGFPVDNLYSAGTGSMRSVFEIPAGTRAAVALPPDAPPLAPGMALYLASSQSVKRSFPFHRPKRGEFGVRYAVDVEARVAGIDETTASLVCSASMPMPPFLRNVLGPDAPPALSASVRAERGAFPARDASGAEQAAKNAFERLGGGLFRLNGWRFENPDSLYVRPGVWNGVRRQLVEALERTYNEAKAGAGDAMIRRVLPPPGGGESALLGALDELAAVNAGGIDAPPVFPGFEARRRAALDELADIRREGFAWHVWVDDPSCLALFGADDFAACREATISVVPGGEGSLARELAVLAGKMDAEAIRLAAPLLVRGGDEARLVATIGALRRDGWRRWCVSGLAGWRLLSGQDDVDITADWPLYCLNRLSAKQLLDMGMSAVTLSPEDEASNMAALLGEFPGQTVVVAYADTPLFISAACAHAHAGPHGPSGEGGRVRQPMPIRMDRGGDAVVWPAGRGSVVTGSVPFSLAGELDSLREMGARAVRVDLRWRPYSSAEAVEVWRACRAGTLVGNPGNFRRGLL